MRHGMIFAVLLSGFATLAAAQGTVTAAPDGLARVRSWTFNELYVRPDADLAAYRAVMIDPPSVAFDAEWLKQMNATRGPSRWIGADEAKRMAEQYAQDMARAFADGFAASGYRIVDAPGPGVLRLTPRIDDLFVDAPYEPAPGQRLQLSGESAGDATLALDARDAQSGRLLARIVDHRSARQVRQRGNVTTDVSNRFYLASLFRQWANESARTFSGKTGVS